MNDEQINQLKDSIDKVAGMKHRAIIIFGTEDINSSRSTVLSAGDIVNVDEKELKKLVKKVSAVKKNEDVNNKATKELQNLMERISDLRDSGSVIEGKFMLFAEEVEDVIQAKIDQLNSNGDWDRE